MTVTTEAAYRIHAHFGVWLVGKKLRAHIRAEINIIHCAGPYYDTFRGQKCHHERHGDYNCFSKEMGHFKPVSVTSFALRNLLLQLKYYALQMTTKRTFSKISAEGGRETQEAPK